MNKSYDIRRIGGDKIALLALFALSLVTARIVVELKSTLVVSDPIPLPGHDISVAVPRGNGWQSRQTWIPKGNSFILSSSFSPGPGEATAGLLCRYQPAFGANSLRMKFEQKADNFDGVVVETNQIATDSLIFNWAQIKGEQSPLTAFVGIAILSEDWQLDIEVFEFTGDVEQAEKTFKRVVESVNFRDSRLRTALSKN